LSRLDPLTIAKQYFNQSLHVFRLAKFEKVIHTTLFRLLHRCFSTKADISTDKRRASVFGKTFNQIKKGSPGISAWRLIAWLNVHIQHQPKVRNRIGVKHIGKPSRCMRIKTYHNSFLSAVKRLHG